MGFFLLETVWFLFQGICFFPQVLEIFSHCLIKYIFFIFLFSSSGTPIMKMLECLMLPWKFLKLWFCCSVTQSCLTSQPHGLQHARAPCPSPSPGVCPSSCPLHRNAIQPSHPLSLNYTHFNSFILYAVLIRLFPLFCLPHYLCIHLHHLHFFTTVVVLLSLSFIFPSLR